MMRQAKALDLDKSQRASIHPGANRGSRCALNRPAGIASYSNHAADVLACSTRPKS